MFNTKMLAAVFSIALVLIIMWPVVENLRKKPADNFPLSYYPMFSHKRKATYSFAYFVGYDGAGNRYSIPYKIIGKGGFNQVRRQVRNYAKNGTGDQLAERVAKRLRKSKDENLGKVSRLALVKGTYHLEDYFLANKKQPLKEKVYTTYEIKNL